MCREIRARRKVVAAIRARAEIFGTRCRVIVRHTRREVIRLRCRRIGILTTRREIRAIRRERNKKTRAKT